MVNRHDSLLSPSWPKCISSWKRRVARTTADSLRSQSKFIRPSKRFHQEHLDSTSKPSLPLVNLQPPSLKKTSLRILHNLKIPPERPRPRPPIKQDKTRPPHNKSLKTHNMPNKLDAFPLSSHGQNQQHPRIKPHSHPQIHRPETTSSPIRKHQKTSRSRLKHLQLHILELVLPKQRKSKEIQRHLQQK